MKTYKIQVWHDYQVTDTYEVEVQASSEEEAMQLAEEEAMQLAEQAVENGEGELWGEGDRMEHAFEANENSIEELD